MIFSLLHFSKQNVNKFKINNYENKQKEKFANVRND